MSLSWVQIFRMGLVQMCLGAVVVLTTSTLNRLMVVELALPAVLRRSPEARGRCAAQWPVQRSCMCDRGDTQDSAV